MSSPNQTARWCAEIVSYAYAATVLVAVLVFKVELTFWHSSAAVALFLFMRYVVYDLRKDQYEAEFIRKKEAARLRAKSPLRWSVEQRDGYGRSVDTKA